MISRFFIDRPIFASVVSAFIVIAGLAAIRALPVAVTRARRRLARVPRGPLATINGRCTA